MALRGLILLALSAFMVFPQSPFPADRPPHTSNPPSDRLPDGRSRTEEILKADHAQSLKDLDELKKLTEEVKIEFEKNDRHVLSVGALKKLEEMEKLAKKIRSRMKRF